jgi:hypothetical protein
MKNWKQWTSVAIIAVFGIMVGFIACDDGNEKDDPKDQIKTITVFDDVKITVKGINLTATEWNGAATAIETAINDEYKDAPSVITDALKILYAKCKTMYVEKTSEYNQWKTIGDGQTIYINFNVLDSGNFISVLTKAYDSMYNGRKEKDGVEY